MKGVSAVISIILILMITVALAAMAYVWFTSVFETITKGAGEAAAGTQTAIGTQFSIESAKNLTADKITVTIRNTGKENIDMTNIAAYVDNVKQDTEGNTGTIGYQKTSTFEVVNVTEPCAKALKLTVGTGYGQTTTVSC